MWTVCFLIALAVFAAGIVMMVLISKRAVKVSTTVTPYRVLFFCVAAATFILLIPIYSKQAGDPSSPGFLTVLRAVLITAQGTFRFFTADADSIMIAEHITADLGAIAPAYSLFLSLLLVAAPVLTITFVLLLFKDTAVQVKLLFARRKEVYAFSVLDERSITLAEDLRKNHPKSAIIFASVDESSDDLSSRAYAIKALCSSRDITALRLEKHNARGAESRTSGLYLYTISQDEHLNLTQAMHLIKTCGQVANSFLYVFCTLTESDLLLGDKKKTERAMRVFRVNEIRSMIYRYLYQDGIDLFHKARETENGVKTIHAVIVGLGSYGTELLKALSWVCQMPDYRLEVDAFDKDPQAEDRFAAQCPELIDPAYNGRYIRGDAFYDIRIHSGTDAGSRTFADEISRLKDVTCAFVTCGTDEENIRVSVSLRVLFERMHIKPTINAVVYDTYMKDALTDIADYKGNKYEIEHFGTLQETFSERVIMSSELEKAALLHHLQWGEEDSFWQYEYNYRSSMASALHMKIKTELRIAGIEKPEKDWTPEEAAVLMELEHCRWNAYMRSEGYIRGGCKATKNQDALGKMHFDIIPYEVLTDDEKEKDRRVGSKKV